MTPLGFTEFAVNLRGKPIDLTRRPWLWDIYDMPYMMHDEDEDFHRKQLLLFGRQCEKSTTIGNVLLANSNLNSYLRSLYVSASDVQMREFSDERLRAVIMDSPKLQRMAGAGKKGGKKETQNVQTKRWTNFSKILLRSVYRSADRVRGISCDLLGCDEIQDIYTDTLPVIEETQFASDLEGGPISIYAGTPKTYDNALEFYWSRYSTMNEWLIKCERCRNHNVIETDNIFEDGLHCARCDKLLNPMENGQWVRMGKGTNEWEGFRVPQPVVIHAFSDRPKVFRRKWRDLLLKKRKYPRAKFENEVMARSFDSGTKPVTYQEVRACCLSDLEFLTEQDVDRHVKSTQTWAGIDWGTGDQSFTVLSIWRYANNGVFTCIFAKKYEGIEADADYSIKDIIQWCRRFNVNRIGTDWGFGFLSNSQLQKVFGAAKVLCYQHVGKQKLKVAWDKLGAKFTTHRTRVLGDVFTLIKKGPTSGGIAFPKWEQFEHYSRDILSVYQENSEKRGELVYDHPRDVPDDFLHTICYALLASQFDHERQDLHAPRPGQKDFTG